MKKPIHFTIFLLFSLTLIMATAVYAASPQTPTSPQATNVWTQQPKLTDPFPLATGEFGYAVAIDGDTAVVGARNSNNNQGAAYVYVRSGNTWSYQQRLIADDGNIYGTHSPPPINNWHSKQNDHTVEICI